MDDNGFIYAGSSYFSRVSVYTPVGEFVRAWPVGKNDVPVTLVFKQIPRKICHGDGNVETSPTPGKAMPSFTGEIKCYPLRLFTKNRVHDAKSIKIVNPEAFPTIVRVENDGSETVLARPPIYFLTIVHPVYGFGVAALGFPIFIVMIVIFGLVAKLVTYATRLFR